MAGDLAAASVNRSYQLAASSIAIFTFVLFFLYPRFVSGEVDALPFQATLIVMGVATFSFAFSSLYYYGASLDGRLDDVERTRYSRRGDRFWLLGCVLLFLAPSLILFTVRLLAVASAWFVLWLAYVLFVIRNSPASRLRRSAELAAILGRLLRRLQQEAIGPHDVMRFRLVGIGGVAYARQGNRHRRDRKCRQRD